MANPIKKALNKNKKLPIVTPFTEGNDMLGFYQSWINSPEYKQRLVNNQYSNPDQIIHNRSNAIGNLSIGYNNNQPNVANAPPTPNSKAFVNINTDQANQLGVPVDSVTAHEVSHAIGAKGISNKNVGFNPIESNLLKNSIIQQPLSNDPVTNAHRRHLNNPEEIKADLDASRYNLFNKGVFDIRKDGQFTPDHLNKAKETFKNDGSFNRLIDQVGDDNYVNLMNTIASNDTSNTNNTVMAKYGGAINPMQQQYFLGGALGQGFNPGEASSGAGMGMSMLSGLIPQQNKQGMTSIGGSTASGALQGASAGAALGPFGMIGGAVLGGGMSLINAQKQRAEEEKQLQTQRDTNSRNTLANMNYGVGQGSNLPMANGGAINPIGSFNMFDGGGTHEQNPNGGIPQGINGQGQQMTVEEGESKFKFKDSDYIFSNRLKFQ